MERRTVRTTVSSLTDAERDALTTRARGYGLELAPHETVFVTESSQPRSVLGIRRQPRLVRTALFVTPQALLIAVTNDGSTTVLHARPAALKTGASRLRENPLVAAKSAGAADGAAADVSADGMSISGFATHVDGIATTASYYLGLGGPDGEAARQHVVRHVAGPNA